MHVCLYVCWLVGLSVGRYVGWLFCYSDGRFGFVFDVVCCFPLARLLVCLVGCLSLFVCAVVLVLVCACVGWLVGR